MHTPVPFPQDDESTKGFLKRLWKVVTKDLKDDLGTSTFDLWLSDFKLVALDQNEVVMRAPGSMYAIWVEENFKETILSHFQKHIADCKSIRFDVATAEQQAKKERKRAAKAKSEKEKSEQVTHLKPKVLVEVASDDKIRRRGLEAGLVETFSFDNFVPGENSELGWAAAKAVAAEPGKTYQPLFFHSPSGLGKTHLLHGIGWESLRLRPRSKVIFVTAEQFANDYIDAIQKNSLMSFRKKYREADLLLIDDVQFLGRKEGLQQEFFHTFNRLADLRKQIVLASDCPATEIVQLEERLVSRFQWGLTAEIHRPGLETRAAILRRKRDDWNMEVSDEMIDSIVERVSGNVRALEGALIRVAMVATMNEEELRPEEVPKVIADICNCEDGKNIGMGEIKKAVAEHYNVDVEILDGKKRTARVAEARQVAMFLIRTLTDFSLVEIAANFGKDHGTVIYAVRKVKKRCEDSPATKNAVELIKRKLARGGTQVESKKTFTRNARPRISSNPEGIDLEGE
ncbi:MAG: chromosomal replication initiator protein DnaA [Verrucomicrobiales bacterium]|nr:chromosomal replication initiator protein DnaA [Verrucomicrobiales bacterium]